MAKAKASTKSASPEKVEDPLPKDVTQILESPEQFEWWVSSKSPRDMTPSVEYTGRIAIAMLHTYLSERMTQPDRLQEVRFGMGEPRVLYTPLNSHHSLNAVDLPRWAVGMVYNISLRGEMPYYKFHRELLAYITALSNDDNDDDD